MKTRTKRKNAKLKRLEKENEKYITIVEELQQKIKSDNYYQQQNQKLIEWVQKIIDTFGTYNVKDKQGIQIPILEKIDQWNSSIGNEIVQQDTVIIPEIIISKMNWRR